MSHKCDRYKDHTALTEYLRTGRRGKEKLHDPALTEGKHPAGGFSHHFIVRNEKESLMIFPV